ncbi:T9SS C-terminal target domain-containing protein [Marinilabiliaceae bacterium JC017]|nr:T9SS C-terminal target domain-containing protein [Marinilabiliaceae bacterium JC017]
MNQNFTKRLKTSSVKLLCAVVAIVFFQAVNAQITPTDGIVYVKTEGAGTEDGSSWANATADLQDAINTAGVTEVWVAAGTYKPISAPDAEDPRNVSFKLKSNVSIYGGFLGDESEVTDRDPKANVTVLSGDIGAEDDNSDNCYHVILANGVNDAAKISGFSIIKGNADGKDSNGYGGGIFMLYSRPTISDCVITNNSSISLGGGIEIEGSSVPKIINCVISNNSSNQGGGLYIYSKGAKAEVYNCLIVNNSTSDGGQGGGIYLETAAINIVNSTISANQSGNGAGIHNNKSEVTVKNSIVWGNEGVDIVSSGGTDATAPTITYSCIEGRFGGEGNLDSDPLFFDVAANNFRLQATSPCVNNGVNADDNSAVPVESLNDLAGNERTANMTVDMGAYERQVQTITFEPFGEVTYGTASVTPSVTASSGLEIVLSSASEDVAVVEDGVLKIKKVGRSVITATQAGDDTYDKKMAICTLTVSKGTPVITTLPTASVIKRGEKLAQSTLSGGEAEIGGQPCDGKFAFKNENLVPSVDNQKVDIVFVPTDNVNCNPVKDQVVVPVDFETAMDEVSDQSLKVYPTIVRDGRITVEQASQETLRIEVLDFAGRVIKEKSASATSIDVDLAGAPSGNLFIRITETSGTTTSFKIIKR